MTEKNTLNKYKLVGAVVLILIIGVIIYIAFPRSTVPVDITQKIEAIQNDVQTAIQEIEQTRETVRKEVGSIEKNVRATVDAYKPDDVANAFNDMLSERRGRP